MPVKRRRNLVEIDRVSYYKEEWLEEFSDSKGAFYDGNESDNADQSYDENNEQQELPEGFGNGCYKIVSPILLQKLINDFAVCEHQKHCTETLSLVEDISHSFEFSDKIPGFLKTIELWLNCCIGFCITHWVLSNYNKTSP